jgi:hypothetical protein
MKLTTGGKNKPITIMKNILITFIVGGYFALPIMAQAPNESYLMKPEIEQAIVKMRADHSNAELLQALSGVQGQKDQVAQVLLASIRILDLQERNEVLSMFFKFPIEENGINLTHTPLLVDLYVKSVQSPLPSKPWPRSFLKDSYLQSLLLDFIAALLDVESVKSSLSDAPPLPRLLQLLEAARDSSSLPATTQKMIEDNISKVKSVANAGPDKAGALKRNPTTPNDESTPWSMIVVLIVALIVAACGVLLKRRS